MAANGIKEVDLKKAARAAANWISSEEGQKALKECLRRCKEINKKLDEAHRPDPKVLDIRFTI
jgi:hypothetical protein